jgi:hypothetical protein
LKDIAHSAFCGFSVRDGGSMICLAKNAPMTAERFIHDIQRSAEIAK